MAECNDPKCSCSCSNNRGSTAQLEGIKTVRRAGQVLSGEDARSRLDTFRLTGLDCADCAAKLEKRLAQMAGVESVEVNFGASKLTARHSACVKEIIRAVEEAGYGAEPAGVTVENKPALFWEDVKLLLTAFSGLLLLTGFAASLFNAPNQAIVALFIAAMLSGGLITAKNAYYSIKSLSIDMNVLMSVAVIGAAAIGEWAEGATVVFLFALGNTLQAYSMDKTRNSIRALMELSPRQALVRRGDREMVLPVEEIKIGDIVIVKPGESIAMDGRVLIGTSMVNQAPITGESMPVEKSPGAEVFAGTINEAGALEIEVTRLVQDTTLAKIVNMVEEAQAQKAPSQQFVDVFARYYTPVVIAAALAIAVIPPLALGLPFEPWLEKALILLVIACPCALVISTPVSIVSAIGSAARRGVLIKGGAYLEEAGALKVVAFDKTGTLTEGSPAVTDVIPVGGHAEKDVVAIAAAVENRSQHPLARAILRHAGQLAVTPPASTEFQSITGKGASVIINGNPYYIGNARLFDDLRVDTTGLRQTLTRLQKEGKTAMLIGSRATIMGIIAVADQMRTNSADTVQGLRAAGIQKMIMLTGDNSDTARAIASELKLDDFRAELLPEDKLKVIKHLQQQYGKVGMVGDGVNDAPALATANIGIAMGGAGTDTALETADIALMADDLSNLPYAVDLSRRALKIIKQNIIFALLVKAAFIAGTLWGVTNLWMAVFADTGAALMVIANGMRLMRVSGNTSLAGPQQDIVGDVVYQNS
ncbi:heavy metal translocating P-type ATPase [Desulfotruncus alcoholivorax]|uniref:heavy metal translocating P-type ATPase n=1 Tax=Desulfotruncus alcoholivorax TaxID=265477 RepID=UPI0004019548|nr:heavy metal translocating P-type ATPase [Desulfotruncus alcoholivorax]